MSNLNVVKTRFKQTKIILCDSQSSICNAWKERFGKYSNIFIYHDYFENVINYLETNNKNNDDIAIVAPANSYGLMDGGYDKAIINYFGNALKIKVQQEILERFCGEQPVGTSFAVNIPNHESCVLIHTPTMRRPTAIRDSSIVYHCTRSSLLCAINQMCDTIILPAFGGLTGGVPAGDVAFYMERAVAQLMNPPLDISTWDYVRNHHPLSNFK